MVQFQFQSIVWLISLNSLNIRSEIWRQSQINHTEHGYWKLLIPENFPNRHKPSWQLLAFEKLADSRYFAEVAEGTKFIVAETFCDYNKI